MFNAVQALPAGPGEPDDVFPLRDRIRLRDNFGFVLQELRKRGTAFRSLAKGPWSVFIAIATHFQLNAEAWPGQEAIAQFSGCSTRAVRFHVATLEHGGFLTLRRERRPDGGERIFYSPGPLLLGELAAFSGDYPKDRPKVLKPLTTTPPTLPPTSNQPPEAPSEPLAETLSMEPDQDQIEPSSCETRVEPLATSRPKEEQPVDVSTEDEQVARQALAERMARKHPTRRPPKSFDAREVAMVAWCAATLDGGVEEKSLALRDAITGAFLVSKDGPPTARFIWEKFDHFLDHVERGRRRRLAEDRNARMRAAAGQREESTLQGPSPAVISHVRMAADIERLFGPNWGRRASS